MQLRFSVAARDRSFSKAMRRVSLQIQPWLDSFAAVELENPRYEAILVLFTDDRPSGYFDKVKSNDEYFQVIAGCSLPKSDQELKEELIDIFRKAVRLCPLESRNRQALEALFESEADL